MNGNSERDRATGTSDRILEAALDEFSQHGFAGARVERIAERADANIALIYRHFGNKRELQHHVLMAIASEGAEVSAASPPRLADRLESFSRTMDSARWRRAIRILLWAELEGTPSPLAHDSTGPDTAREVERIVNEQQDGFIDQRLHPGFLYLLETALFTYLHVLWSWAGAVTGIEPGSAAYEIEAQQFIRTLAELLAPR